MNNVFEIVKREVKSLDDKGNVTASFSVERPTGERILILSAFIKRHALSVIKTFDYRVKWVLDGEVCQTTGDTLNISDTEFWFRAKNGDGTVMETPHLAVSELSSHFGFLPDAVVADVVNVSRDAPQDIALSCYGISLSGTSITSDLHEDVVPGTPLDGAMHAIESMVLAHHCAGLDVSSPEYMEGIEMAVEGCDHTLDGGVE